MEILISRLRILDIYRRVWGEILLQGEVSLRSHRLLSLFPFLSLLYSQSPAGEGKMAEFQD